MVKWCCRLNLNACTPRLVAVVCLFASQLLLAQGSSSTGGNTQENSVQRSANSIFNATIDLNTTAGVIKSENDKRNYRYLVLDNQLRVLLISEIGRAHV